MTKKLVIGQTYLPCQSLQVARSTTFAASFLLAKLTLPKVLIDLVIGQDR